MKTLASVRSSMSGQGQKLNFRQAFFGPNIVAIHPQIELQQEADRLYFLDHVLMLFNLVSRLACLHVHDFASRSQPKATDELADPQDLASPDVESIEQDAATPSPSGALSPHDIDPEHKGEPQQQPEPEPQPPATMASMSTVDGKAAPKIGKVRWIRVDAVAPCSSRSLACCRNNHRTCTTFWRAMSATLAT